MFTVNQNSSLQSLYETSAVALRNGPRGWAVFMLFIPIIRNTALIRQREDVSDYTGIDLWALIDISALGLCSIILFCNFYRMPWKVIFRSSYKWWLLYYVLCTLSVFWRIEGSSISYILYRAISMLIFSLYIFWLMSQFNDAESAFAGLMKYIFWIMILGLAGHIRLEDLHTNSYSVSAAVLAIMALSTYQFGIHRRSEIKWYLITGVTCLLLGTSGGSNVAFACGLAFLPAFSKAKISVIRLILTGALLWFGYVFLLEDVLNLLFPGKTIEGIESGTGRFKMWEVYWEAWKLRPWLGYGFAVGERAGELFDYVYTLSAHNGFVSVLINTGLWGCVLWGSFFFKFICDVFQSIRNTVPYAATVMTAIVVISVNNLSVPIIGSTWGPLATIALLIISFFILFVMNQTKEISNAV